MSDPNTINRFGFDCTIDDEQNVTIALDGDSVVLPFLTFSRCVRDSHNSETFTEKVLEAKEMESANAQGPISKRQSVPPAE